METRIPDDKHPGDLLKHLEKIAYSARDSAFKKEFLRKNSKELKALSAFLEITELQAAIFCVVLNLNFGKQSVDLSEIAAYIGCNAIAILGFHHDLDEMIRRGIIRRYESSSHSRRGRNFNINNVEFFVNREVLDAIRSEESFIREAVHISDVHDLLAVLTPLFLGYRDGEYSYRELVIEIESLLENSENLPFVKGIDKLSLRNEDLLFFLFLCTEFLDDDEAIDLLEAIKLVYPEIGDRMRVRKEFLRGTHSLIKAGLVKMEESHFRSDKQIALTDKGIELLLQDDKELFVVNKENKRTFSGILASSIKPKELYFSGNEIRSLNFLTEALMPENHAQLLQRMKDANMRTGISVLLYGPPGTGKTESVYQLARKTGRDIHMISISETKSMWFGESEKLIKKVFDEYRTKVEKSQVAPILLFNEADGIFSSRKKIGSSSVDQTENAIQNIILQEMEDLQGILIATTNHTQNLDKAFERRFLYKICFENPNPEARIRIWQDKVIGLSADDARLLSKTFDLSGGQIENIARKCLLQQLLYGSFPTVAEIENFCREEQITRSGIRKIGFNRDNDIKVIIAS